MKHGTYVGPIEHLRGKTALVIEDDKCYKAQFDDANVTLHGLGIIPSAALGYGWTSFPKEHFELEQT